MPLPAPRLSDAVVGVREIEERDAEAFACAAGDGVLPRLAYHTTTEFTLEFVREYIGKVRAAREAGEQLVLTTADPVSDEMIGLTMLFGFNWKTRVAEIGFWGAPWSRGRGTCTRAVELTTVWAFEELRLERVQAFTDAANTPARRLLERAGFQHEGVHRGLELVDGVRVDQVSFARLHTEAGTSG